MRRLIEADEDFEFYPTTEEMTAVVASDIKLLNRASRHRRDEKIRVMDIGAGDGRVLTEISAHLRSDEWYENISVEQFAMEKSTRLTRKLFGEPTKSAFESSRKTLRNGSDPNRSPGSAYSPLKARHQTSMTVQTQVPTKYDRAFIQKTEATVVDVMLGDERIGSALTYAYEDGISFSRLWVKPSHRENGIASGIVQSICESTDQPIYVEPSAFGADAGMSTHQLIGWYQRLGFERIGTTRIWCRQSKDA
ncbi:MAG: GNAT family N-acetyltransferase [Planctomycetota bacterium]